MNVNLALGAVAPKVQAKTADEGGKAFDQTGHGFDDVLKAGTDGPKRALARDSGDETGPAWKMESYDPRLGLRPQIVPVADAAGEGIEIEAPVPEGDAEDTDSGDNAILNVVQPPEAIPASAMVKVPLAGNEGTRPAEASSKPSAEPDADPRAGRGKAAPTLIDIVAAATNRGDQNARTALGNGEPVAAIAIPRPTGLRSRDAEGGRVEPSNTKSDTPRMTAARHTADAARPMPRAADGVSRDPVRPAAVVVNQVDPVETHSGGSEGRSAGEKNARAPAPAPAAKALAPAPAADALAPRVSVLGFSSAPSPAPVAGILSPTASGLVSAIEAEPTWRAAAQETTSLNGQRGQGNAGGTSTLRIQLNPAELGMVTARLTTTGSQLSIEIQVESNDARQRLTNDGDAILKALRAVGIDVEKVTVLQSAPSNSGNSAQQGMPGREQAMPNQQAQGDGSQKGQRERGTAGGHQEGQRNGSGEAALDRSGGGVYI